MTNVLLILFIISLLYVSIANRIITYVRILALQGFMLFGVTFLQLQDIQTWNLVLILLETIIFKAVERHGIWCLFFWKQSFSRQ